MNSKTKTGIAMMALVFGIAISPLLSNDAEARSFDPTSLLQGQLTAPSDDKPFGGDVVGKYILASYDMAALEDRTTIYVQLDVRAPEGTVYEGWLVDADTGEKTSFGTFGDSRHTQQFTTSVESDFNNDIVVITEEPRNDTDPAPATPVGGAVLRTPFGL